MSDKIYCGNGKEKVFQDGGSIIEVLLDVDDLAKNFKEHGFTTNGNPPKRKIRIKVCRSRNVDQYGNTHYAEIDTWKPNQQNQPQGNMNPQGQQGQFQGGGNQGYGNQPPGGQGGQNNQNLSGYGNQGRPAQGPPPTSFEDDIPF